MRRQRTLTIPAVTAGAAASALVSGGLLAGPAIAAPAGPAITLTLSAANVAFGEEQAEHLTVTVRSGAGGTPGGTVVIRAGAAVICAPALAGGQASCTLPATLLSPGSYQLTALYNGDATFDGSTSDSRDLTITSAQAGTPPASTPPPSTPRTSARPASTPPASAPPSRPATGQESDREQAELTVT
jgi:hypothetical protein